MPVSLAPLVWERADAPSISVRIAALVAKEIVQGSRAAGSWLVEAELAALADASRTPAREAMLLLESWGLVRLVPKKGAIVTVVDHAERRDLLALRVMFETSAVDLVASAGPRDAFAAELREVLDQQAAAVSGGDVLACAGADYAFHARVIQEGGNGVVIGILDSLAPRLARLTHQAVTDRPERMRTLLTEHRELAELVIAGDAAGYARALRAHVASGHAMPDAAS